MTVNKITTQEEHPIDHNSPCHVAKQEAQLPHRNSASAAHMEGAGPPAHSPPPPLATPMRMVESETRNKRTYVKRAIH